MHRGTGVLVVGGGFLGSHLVAGLAAEGARVTVLTRTRPQGGAAARIAGARTVVSDAADPAAVEHAARERRSCGVVRRRPAPRRFQPRPRSPTSGMRCPRY